MNIYVVSFDKIEENKYSFVTKGIVTDYISLQWVDKYYENGSFNLVLPANEENMELFQEGLYLVCGETDTCMMIESVDFNNNLKSDGHIMQVSGRSIEAILERRVAFPGQGLNTNEFKGANGLIKAIYELIDGFFINPEKIAMESSDGSKYFYYPERKVPFLTIPEENERYYKEINSKYILRPFHESINKTVSKDNLLKIISELCKNSYLGFKIRPKEKTPNSGNIIWEFSLYTGKDKSYTRSDKNKPLLLFSPKLNNVEAVSTKKDITNYRNVIFCGVEKDSDGYIDLTKTGNEANGFNQKTGIDVVDSINSGATSLITGIKDRLVTLLESSPVCYTGIYILAIAASRKDKDYTATVTNIEDASEAGQTEIYLNKNGYEEVTKKILNSENGDFYFEAVLTKGANSSNVTANVDVDDIENNMYCKLILPNMSNEGKIGFRYAYRENGKYYFTDFISFSDPQSRIIKNYDNYYYITAKNNYEYLDNLSPVLIIRDGSGNYITTDKIGFQYKYSIYDDPNNPQLIGTYVGIPLHFDYKTHDKINVKHYPTNYIYKETAENITITIRKAFGDVNEGSSNKTTCFKLSDVNEAVSEGRLDFKNSTAFGWLTTPILNQAINDFNNLNFGNIIEKSAIQAWFKTLDKYTSSTSQKRWLCQTYEYDSDNSGLNRREVFVEEDSSDSDEWNASAINSFQSSTATISIDQDEDEESDEKINERLMESARKRSGDYRKKRETDASLEMESFEYRSDSQNGYDLGDIIQVDDGWGNLDQYIITGVTITNDTSSGFRKIPTFEKYEYLPKQYHQLDYLQVANMMLPAKFNRHFSGEQDATGINLPSNVYFGSKRVDDGIDNPMLPNIEDIKSETIGVVTDIECELAYVKKDSINGENVDDLAPCFALISAIGSQKRSFFVDSNGEQLRYNGINLPFALVSHTYNGPYHFMTKHNDNFVSSRRYVNMYIGCQVEYNNNKSDIYYNIGDGDKQKCLINVDGDLAIKGYWWDDYHGSDLSGEIYFKNNSNIEPITIDHNNVENYLYMINDLEIDQSQKNKYIINKIYEENPEYSYVNNIISTDNQFPIYCLCKYYDAPMYNVNSGGSAISLLYFEKVLGTGEVEEIGIVDYGAYYDGHIYWNSQGAYNYYRTSASVYSINDVICFRIYNDLQDYIYCDIFYLKDNEGNIYRIENYVKDNSLRKARGTVAVISGSTIKGYTLYDLNDNKILSVIQNAIPESHTNEEKKIFYSRTSVGLNSIEISKKSLTKSYYKDNLYYIGDDYDVKDYDYYCFINKPTPLIRYTESDFLMISKITMPSNMHNILTKSLLNGNMTEYMPHIGNNTTKILLDDVGWGQDNYRLPEYYSSEQIENGYNREYQDLLYENNIVLGGCGVYIYDERDARHDYMLKFYKYDVEEDNDPTHSSYAPLADIAPKACDTVNGVRIYGTVKIYETICSSRQIWFYRINSYGEPTFVNFYNDDTDRKTYNSSTDIKAYYPDLSTRKLVHEYVPVRYIEGGNDILKEEEYGLYDLIDKVFVPINWGGNDAATFIQAGGEINNE